MALFRHQVLERDVTLELLLRSVQAQWHSKIGDSPRRLRTAGEIQEIR